MKYDYNLDDILKELNGEETYWTSFLEKSDFELGVIKIEPGTKDTQSPHQSDEVYFIISGDGMINIDGKDIEIYPHQAIFVPKLTKHHFHSNTSTILAYYALN